MKTKLQLIKIFLSIRIRKLNSICNVYEHLIETLGIAVGLLLIYLTYTSVKISSEQLKISQKQEYQKQLPIWEFNIDSNDEIAKLRPFTSDVKLEQATAHFPSNLFFRNCDWEIDQPDFEFHMTLFKEYVSELIMANIKFDPSKIAVSTRNNFPVGIELVYVQFGELRTVNAIFSIQYLCVWSDKYSLVVTVQGIKFSKYLMNNETLKDELNKIVAEDFKDIKRPKDY